MGGRSPSSTDSTQPHPTPQEHAIPEVQRSNLAWMALQLKALGIDQVMAFDFISQPSAEAMMRGLELLYALGAVDDRCRLTPGLGEKMAGACVRRRATCKRASCILPPA